MDKQMVFENTHPALIDLDTFEWVQAIRSNRQQHKRIGGEGLFSGLLFYADCGSKMYHHRGSSVKENAEYYTCAGYSKRVNPCTTHHIRVSVLKAIVTANLRQVTQFAAEHETMFTDMLTETSMKEQKCELAEMQRTLDTQQARYTELDTIIQCLYEDTVLGKLSDEQFAKLSAGYEAEQKKLEASIKELSAVLSQKKDKTVNVSRFLNIVKKNLALEDLTPDILNAFIEKIIVHEADKSTGKRVQKIKIVYNFIGNIEIPQEQPKMELVELPKVPSRKRKKSA